MTGTEEVIRIVEHAAERLSEDSLAALRRQAWMPAHGDLPLSALRVIAMRLPDEISLDTDTLADGTLFPARHARVLLNLVLLAVEALPDGGTIALGGTATDTFVRIAGSRAAWTPGFAALPHDLDAAVAAVATEAGFQAGLTVLLAREAGLRLSLVMPPTRQPAPPVLRLTTEN